MILYSLIAFLVGTLAMLMWRKPEKKFFRSILITGASKGIGKQLAVEFSKKPYPKRLFLVARNLFELEKVADECYKYGADVVVHQADVTNRAKMTRIIKEIFEMDPPDLVIANAGTTLYTSSLNEPDDAIYNLYNVNINGVINTILPTITEMKTRKKKGTIAIMGSQASCMVLPGASAFYASSKVAIGYLRGLRKILDPIGINLTMVQPGYIQTAMTEKTDKTPGVHHFIMDLKESCHKIIIGLEYGENEICFPRSGYYLMNFVNVLPWRIQERIWKYLPNLIMGENYE